MEHLENEKLLVSTRLKEIIMSVQLKRNRPLSPHLTIYKPQFTSVLSILHRITGLGLLVSLILLTIWFLALRFGTHWFGVINTLFDSLLIQMILAISVWALWYHTFTGIRHLIWDMGYFLEPKWITPSAYFVLLSSLMFTMITIYLGG